MKLSERFMPILKDTLIHAGLAWGAVSLSYNSYKQYYRYSTYFNKLIDIRGHIRGTFSTAIAIFVILYLIIKVIQNKRGVLVNVNPYLMLFIPHLIAVNIIFKNSAPYIIIVQNIALLYLYLLLYLWGFVKHRGSLKDFQETAESILPPVIYKKLPFWADYVAGYDYRKNFSRCCIIGFIISLLMSAVFLLCKQERSAQDTVDIGYFLLMAAVGKEIYDLGIQWIKKR